MNAISVIMPCFNRAYDLERVLKAYDNQCAQDAFELIAIDDASTDSTYALLTSFHPVHFALCVERQPKNLGPAAARNRGIALASAPLVLFVGDDILPTPDFVQGHLNAHKQYPGSVAILGRVLWADDLPQNTLMAHIDGVGAQQFSYHYFRDNTLYDFRHLYTANISLKRNALTGLDHWFDTDFSYPAFEDVELGYRLARRGMQIIYMANVLGYHLHYHTIWTFATRQYRSGLMSWYALRKHPTGVGRVLYRQYLKLVMLACEAGGVLRPYSASTISHLENQALHLASFYEWSPHALLDRLYIELLDYFYYKGVIDGIFGNGKLAEYLRGLHAKRNLAAMFKWFIPNATKIGIPSPFGNDVSLLTQLK